MRGEDEEVIARVRREIEAMGFEVVGSGEREAAAVVEVKQGGRDVEVWTRREGAVDEIALRGEEGIEVLVIGVVEALRARGVGEETSASTGATAATTTTTSATSATTTKTASATVPTATSTPTSRTTSVRDELLWVEGAGLVMGSAGGLAPAVSALVGVRVKALSFGSIAAFGIVPLWRQELRGDEGSASVSIWMLGLAAEGNVQAGAFEFAAGVGIASEIVVMSGEAAGDLKGRAETDVVAAPIVRGSVHWDLGALRLVLRAHGGVSIPRVEVYFDQREAAHWGQPFGALSLGVELPLIER